MDVCCECCVLSGRGLCDELITRPEESYRLWCVVVCDLETSRTRRPWLALGRSATKKICDMWGITLVIEWLRFCVKGINHKSVNTNANVEKLKEDYNKWKGVRCFSGPVCVRV
jgi:hypothetical protein